MPTKAQGLSKSINVGFEDSFKTMPGTVNGDKIPVSDPAFRASRNKFTSNALTGSPQPRQVRFGKTGMEGSFNLEANAESVMPIFKGHFGTVTTSGTSALYQHQYSLSSTMPSMWFEEAHSDISQFILYNGCYIGSLDFNIASEGLMSVGVGVMGAKQTFSGATAVGGTLSDRTDEIALSYLRAYTKINGTKAVSTRGVTLSLNRGLGSDVQQDETDELAVVFSQIATISGSIDLYFENDTYAQLGRIGTECSVEVFVPFGSGKGVIISLPTVVPEPVEIVTDGTGLIRQTFRFDAHARGSATATAGQVRSKFFTTEAGLSGLTLSIKADGGSAQVVTFAGTDDTPEEVAAAINAQTTGCIASVERMYGETGGVVAITSDTTGTGSSVQVEVASTADVTLGYSNTANSGLSNHAVVITVLNTTAA